MLAHLNSYANAPVCYVIRILPIELPLWGLQYGKYHRGTDRRGADGPAVVQQMTTQPALTTLGFATKKPLIHYKIHVMLSNTTVTEIIHSLEFVHLAVFKIENNREPNRSRPLTKVQGRPIRFLNVSFHILNAGWTSPNSVSFPVWHITVRTLWNCITETIHFSTVLCSLLFIMSYSL